MSEWISRKDREPEKPDTYLAAYANGGVWVALYYMNEWKEDDDSIEGLTVTHWQPLPEPPK